MSVDGEPPPVRRHPTVAHALATAAADPAGRGVTFLDTRGEPQRVSHGELLSRAAAAAERLEEAGLGRGERLFLVLPTSVELVVAFYGAILAGVVPCPVGLPLGAQSHVAFRQRLGRLAAALAVRGVVARDDLAPDLRDELGDRLTVLPPAALGSDAAATASAMDDAAARVAAVAPDDLAFMQLTSGSTALPKGVLIRHRAATANLAQIAPASGIVPGDVLVSWLPLHHDMGLVGGLLLAMASGMQLILSSPFSFLRRPASWLRAITDFRGTHSLAPTFAFREVIDRLRDRDLEGLDLRSWRVAWVGAEPVQADILAAFEDRLRPVGLPLTTLLPCYGMAEATLAITFKPFQERYRTQDVSRGALVREGRISPAREPGDETRLVSCGRPLEGTRVAILDGAGRELPEGVLGEITLSGPSLFAGYHGLDEPSPEEISRGFRTGDLGFLDGGELYITGRKKELIIVGGENHHPAEIEWVAGEVEGVRRGRVAAFGVYDPGQGTERLTLVAEIDRRARRTPEAGDLVTEIRRRVREAMGVVVSDVELVDSGSIPVTTSGKIRRSRVKEAYTARRREASATGDTAEASVGR